MIVILAHAVDFFVDRTVEVGKACYKDLNSGLEQRLFRVCKELNVSYDSYQPESEPTLGLIVKTREKVGLLIKMFPFSTTTLH